MTRRAVLLSAFFTAPPSRAETRASFSTPPRHALVLSCGPSCTGSHRQLSVVDGLMNLTCGAHHDVGDRRLIAACDS